MAAHSPSVLYRRVDDDDEKAGFESLAGLELTPAVKSGLVEDGIQRPTAVQVAGIPAILRGGHVVVESATGTGKTLAYLLPILQRLRQTREGRAVCLAPSTELAMQILRVAERYREPGLNVAALVTHGSRRRQTTRPGKSSRLVIGTVPHVLEMVRERRLKGVTTVVLDEPEPILNSREASYLREVLSRPEPRLQLVFVGATFGATAERWIRELMGESAVRTRVEDDPLSTRIEHYFVRVRNPNEKDFVLAQFLNRRQSERAIVFVNQANLVRHVFRCLEAQSLKPVTVSPQRSRQQCKQALLDFNQSKSRVLVTTDQVAKGLDVAHVDWVLHFELPSSAKAYVHRAGRTGRAGRSGKSVAFIGDAERVQLGRIERELGVEFRRIES